MAVAVASIGLDLVGMPGNLTMLLEPRCRIGIGDELATLGLAKLTPTSEPHINFDAPSLNQKKPKSNKARHNSVRYHDITEHRKA